MSNWNLGSVATQVLSLVENVPSAISGAILIDIADRERLFIESWTGESVGSVAIAEKYQGALIDLTCAELLGFMIATGGNASNVRLGDLSISKGASSNLDVAKELFRKRGMEKLQTYGQRAGFYAAFG